MPGSHGSLTKAGKVRSQTPKVVGKERRTPIPRLRNRRNYLKRVLEGTTPGQAKIARR
jgi:small subunit ribosomal protein S30e